MSERDQANFVAYYDLPDTRPEHRTPVQHQKSALERLRAWYEHGHTEKGGLLVIPTGGGKTFTAVRFLCRHAISDGYKVLWLAHTHHLLEQAFDEFAEGKRYIAGPKPELRVRTVSGAKGHWPISRVEPTDDVVIGTVQTVRRAYQKELAQLERFLSSSDGKLIVVFDEAHHTPANTYRKLLLNMRERYPKMQLLGMTATPTYTDENKRGWLGELFPQGILYQARSDDLMASRVLARPKLEDVAVDFTPKFGPDEYSRWVNTNRDLPESVVEQLATSRERNLAVVNHYVSNRDKYGKTLVFADRWPQCVTIEEMLKERSVRAGSVFSQVDLSRCSATERNSRSRDENAKNIEAFKAGELDVLVNIRMLTEGTDVPDAQTVFLTRKTTSRILLTQMVGRALRGPKFGGTDEAYIVSFNDDWRQLIQWAEFDELSGGLSDEATEYGAHAPLPLIRVDLVRKLARQMDAGQNVNALPYTSMLPVGWYRVEYEIAVDGDQTEPRRELLVVFDQQHEAFHALISELEADVPAVFQDEALEPENPLLTEEAAQLIDGWVEHFFDEGHLTDTVPRNVRAIARHMGQNGGRAPKFFPFEARDTHDLDRIAQRTLDERLIEPEIVQLLRTEYRQSDKLWQNLYPTFLNFRNAFEACRNRIMGIGLDEDSDGGPGPITPDMPRRWFTEEERAQIFKRDDGVCVACGHKHALTADHIQPFYFGGQTVISNGQTLCTWCNKLKADRYINFIDELTDLPGPHSRLELYRAPKGEHAKDPEWLESFVRRSVNFFYEAGAVCEVELAQRGERFHHWSVSLYAGNDPKWIEPLLPELVACLRQAKNEAGYTAAPDTITVSAPNAESVRSKMGDAQAV
jgi:superfamily II DNA or RNA helicase